MNVILGISARKVTCVHKRKPPRPLMHVYTSGLSIEGGGRINRPQVSINRSAAFCVRKRCRVFLLRTSYERWGSIPETKSQPVMPKREGGEEPFSSRRRRAFRMSFQHMFSCLESAA